MADTKESRPTRAKLIKKDGTEIPIQFNPVSLQSVLSNTLSQQGSGQRTQYVSQSSAKLTMDLVFDTTDTGKDVREKTFPIAQLMEPGGKEGDAKRAPPSAVEFSWGTFTFKGVVESYRETLDFFAPEGIPLRASVNLTLTKQSHVFERDKSMGSTTHKPESQVLALGGGADLTQVAAWAGDPSGWRELASQNGVENPRAAAGLSIALDADLALPSLDVGLSGGLSVGASFAVGGRAVSGVSADVGSGQSLQVALQFEA